MNENSSHQLLEPSFCCSNVITSHERGDKKIAKATLAKAMITELSPPKQLVARVMPLFGGKIS